MTDQELRGLVAMSCALTNKQAENEDVQAACAWTAKQRLKARGCTLDDSPEAVARIQERFGPDKKPQPWEIGYKYE